MESTETLSTREMLESIMDHLDRIDQRLSVIEEQQNSPWMTIDEAAKYTRLSKSKISKLVSADSIPFRRLPGEKSKLIFSKRSLDMWMIYNKTSFTNKEREKANMWIN